MKTIVCFRNYHIKTEEYLLQLKCNTSPITGKIKEFMLRLQILSRPNAKPKLYKYYWEKKKY